LRSTSRCVSSDDFSWFVADAFEVRKFSKIRNPREIYGHGSRGSWRLGVAGCRQKKSGKILVSPIIERIRARNGDEEGGR